MEREIEDINEALQAGGELLLSPTEGLYAVALLAIGYDIEAIVEFILACRQPIPEGV